MFNIISEVLIIFDFYDINMAMVYEVFRLKTWKVRQHDPKTDDEANPVPRHPVIKHLIFCKREILYFFKAKCL